MLRRSSGARSRVHEDSPDATDEELATLALADGQPVRDLTALLASAGER